MKKVIIIFLIMLGSMTLFCQIRIDGSIEYKIDGQKIPYKLKPVSSSTRGGEIWRPLNGYFYYSNPPPSDPYAESDYQYDTIGILHQISTRYYGDTFAYCVEVFNNTFTKEGFDFGDTLTYYKQQGNESIPDFRYYYDYHYYDRFPEDSFYYVQYQEGWNNDTKEWIPYRKSYQGHFDTTLFIIREAYSADYINGEWVINGGSRILREYNEGGLLSANIIQEYHIQTGKYQTTRKLEYFYDEDDIHIETYHYVYLGDDIWKLAGKMTDIQYTEWYPNGQPGIVIIMTNGPEYVGISDKRVKMKSFTAWTLNDNNEWEKLYMSKHDWDINETKSHIDTLHRFHNDIPYLYAMEAHLYDERGNYTQKWKELFTYPDMYGNVELDDGSKECFHTSYHPIYDEPETYCNWFLSYKKATQSWDSTFLYLFKYFNWHDVTQPMSIAESEPAGSAVLSIVPNPVSGMVAITATAEMQQLSIFDITGRLVESQLPAGERVVFDTGVLPQGVYLVRALLKDGGMRTGKVVVR